MVSQGSTASSLAMPNDNVFRFVPNDHIEGRATTDLLTHQGIRVVVPMWRDDRGNQGLATSVRAAATSEGVEVTAGFQYEPTTTDFGPGLQAVSGQVAAADQRVGAAHVAVYLAGFEETANVLAAAAMTPGLAAVRWYGGDGSAQAVQLLDSAPAASVRGARRAAIPARSSRCPPANERRDAALIRQISPPGPRRRPTRSRSPPTTGSTSPSRRCATHGTTANGTTLRAAFARTADGYPGVTGTIRLDALGDRASAPYAYWSICRPRGQRARWVQTGTWIPSPSNPAGPGQVTGGTCPS